MYDIIGDIHGYADHLEKLLTKLDYENKSGYYKHPERKVIFVGDFIDRGPKIRETLLIVKRMVEENSALAIMGNHEFNFLCYNIEIKPGEFLRKHSEKNNKQVEQTLIQFRNHPNELTDYLNWFKTLPIYLELSDIRIVHASWDQQNIKLLNGNIEFTKEYLIGLYKENGGELYRAIDESLKGKEAHISNGYSFNDKDGHERKEMRIKWWLDPTQSSYDKYYFEDVDELKGKPVDLNDLKSITYYEEDDIPVFCGHYWLTGKPTLQSKNVACVDYSVAAKNNILCAYRWSGEKGLKNENFVWV